MNFKLLSTASAAALTIAVAPAFAVTVNFDSFGTYQYVSDTPQIPGGNTSTVTGAADIWGGSRTLTVKNTVPGNTVNGTDLKSEAGVLAFSNSANSKGTGWLFYDGNGAGLGNMNLGTNTFFYFDGAFFDNDKNVDFTLNAIDGDGRTATYTENLMAGFDPKLTFAQILAGPGSDASFDFGNVQSIEFIISSDGDSLSYDMDGVITGIWVSAVPLPASALLMFGGLGGLAALRRRRKAA